MKTSSSHPYDLIAWSFRFYGRNLLPLLGLMLVAALGRAFQIGATGEISSEGYILLEIAVELSRALILIFLMNYCIGWVANNQRVLAGLKAQHILRTSESANPVVFFLKNLTVIPFTIIFKCGIILWLIGKI